MPLIASSLRAIAAAAAFVVFGFDQMVSLEERKTEEKRTSFQCNVSACMHDACIMTILCPNHMSAARCSGHYLLYLASYSHQ